MPQVTPLVTVCIATKDRATTLPRAIETVLSQTYRHLELIIVDDGSTDQTAAVIAAAKTRDTRVRGVCHHVNRGLAAARNSAIFKGSGEYFTFIDDDDVWDMHYIERCVEVAARDTGMRCYCTGYQSLGALGEIRRYLPCFDGPLREYVIRGYTPPVASQFYVREQLVTVGGYNEAIRSGVDHDLWLRLAAHGARLQAVPYILAFPDTTLVDNTRMTTNFEKRRTRIAESLQIWRPLLSDGYPPGFREHFSRCYAYAIARKEVASLVQQRKIRTALKAMVGAPFPVRLILYVLSRLLGRSAASVRRHRGRERDSCMPPSFPPFRSL